MIDEPAALPNLAELTSMVVDFALFRRYISPAVLVGIYYAGAIAMPVVLSIGYRMILHGRYSPTTAIAPLFDLLRESAGGSRVRLGVAIAVHIRYGPLRAMGLEVDASTSMMGKRPGETSGRRPGRWSRPCRAVRLVQTSVLDSGPQALGS